MIYTTTGFVVDRFGRGDHIGEYCFADKCSRFEYRSEDSTICLFIPQDALMKLFVNFQAEFKRFAAAALGSYMETLSLRLEIKKTIEHYTSKHSNASCKEELFTKIRKRLLVVFPNLKSVNNPALDAVNDNFDEMQGDPVLTTAEDELLKEDNRVREYESPCIKNPFIGLKKVGGTATTASPADHRYSGRVSTKNIITSRIHTANFDSSRKISQRSKGQGPKLSNQNSTLARKLTESDSPNFELMNIDERLEDINQENMTEQFIDFDKSDSEDENNSQTAADFAGKEGDGNDLSDDSIEMDDPIVSMAFTEVTLDIEEALQMLEVSYK